MLKFSGRWSPLVSGILAVCLVAVLPPTAAQAQTAVKAPPAVKQSAPPINLTLMIRPNKGVVLMVDGGKGQGTRNQMYGLQPAPSPDYCDAAKGEVWCTTQDGQCRCHDMAGIYNALVQLQRNFSQPDKPLRQLYVSAEPETPWGLFSAMIDLARCYRGLAAEDGSIRPPSGGLNRLKDYRQSVPRPQNADNPRAGCLELLPQLTFTLAD